MNPDTSLDKLLAAYYEDVLVLLAHRQGWPHEPVSTDEVRMRATRALENSAAIVEALAAEMPALARAAAGVEG